MPRSDFVRRHEAAFRDFHIFLVGALSMENPPWSLISLFQGKSMSLCVREKVRRKKSTRLLYFGFCYARSVFWGICIELFVLTAHYCGLISGDKLLGGFSILVLCVVLFFFFCLNFIPQLQVWGHHTDKIFVHVQGSFLAQDIIGHMTCCQKNQ